MLIPPPSCNLGTWEAEAGGAQVEGLPGLYRETLSPAQKDL
jgi:hypothetical protein